MPRASSPSREGVGADGSIRRVPVRGRCLGSLQGVSFSRGGVGSGLGLLPRFRAAQPPPNGAWCSVGLAKAVPPRTAGGRRQGHQRFDRAVAVGRKRPRLAVSGSPVRRGSTLQPGPPKRSSWRETTVYLGSSQEAARRAPEPGARNPENTREAGFRLDSLDGRSRSVTSWQGTPSAQAVGNDPV